MGVAHKRIGSFCDVRTGKLDANASSENGQYPFFTCSKEPLRIDSYSYDAECVLVAGNGDLNVKYYNGKFDAYQRTYIITLKKGVKDISVRYLYAFFLLYVDTLRAKSIGGVIKYIKLGDITEAMIPIPSLVEQGRIVAELDLLTGIIDKQNQQLSEYDSLAENLFYEMFGNPVQNNKGWEVRRLGDVLKTSSGGTPSKGHAEYYDGGTIPWVNSGDLHQMFLYDVPKCITREGLENSSAKLFPVDSVLVAMYGATVGEVSVLKRESATNQAVCAIFPNKGYSPIFLYSVLKYSKDFFVGKAAGGAQPNISQGVIKDYMLITPSLDLQCAFAERIMAIEHQKDIINRSIIESQKLFDYTMDKYFG